MWRMYLFYVERVFQEHYHVEHFFFGIRNLALEIFVSSSNWVYAFCFDEPLFVYITFQVYLNTCGYISVLG
jgi:hypothetical protein